MVRGWWVVSEGLYRDTGMSKASCCPYLVLAISLKQSPAGVQGITDREGRMVK